MQTEGQATGVERSRKSVAAKRQHAVMTPEQRVARGRKIKAARQAEWDRSTRQRLLAYIRQHPGCSRAAIEAALNPPKTAFRVALSYLKTRGDITAVDGSFYPV